MSSPDATMASSGPFPPEIIQRIVYYLTHDWVGPNGPENPPVSGTIRSWGRIGGGARYATIDRTWQEAVEHETFAELRLDIWRLAEAEAVLNGVPRRQKYVRVIRLDVVLPPRPATAPLRIETADERKQNNRALQHAFEAFLSLLSRWTPGPPVKLDLEAFAMTNEGGREAVGLPAGYSTPHSPLELEDPERIMRCRPVNVITELNMGRNRLFGRPFSGAAIVVLLARLPAAKEISMSPISCWDSRGDSKIRNAFAQALTNITHTIDRFHIAGANAELNRLQPARKPNQYEAKPDTLSQTFGVLSQRLRHLDLYDVVVSDELFLQHNLPPEMASPAHWARLENFTLYYPPVTPYGEWLFYPAQVAWATVASPALQRRYLAAARAALAMPLLKNMTLVAQLVDYRDWHRFWYYRDAKRNFNRVLWSSSSGFVPDDEVLAAWREVPRRHWGDKAELIVEILDDEYAA